MWSNIAWKLIVGKFIARNTILAANYHVRDQLIYSDIYEQGYGRYMIVLVSCKTWSIGLNRRTDDYVRSWSCIFTK